MGARSVITTVAIATVTIATVTIAVTTVAVAITTVAVAIATVIAVTAVVPIGSIVDPAIVPTLAPISLTGAATGVTSPVFSTHPQLDDGDAVVSVLIDVLKETPRASSTKCGGQLAQAQDTVGICIDRPKTCSLRRCLVEMAVAKKKGESQQNDAGQVAENAQPALR